ncbi:TPA: hypothetical protein ROX88_001435 [Bacillus pseudomycoides]|nr:hypothetical protein [Bacillus pseudomycoides]
MKRRKENKYSDKNRYTRRGRMFSRYASKEEQRYSVGVIVLSVMLFIVLKTQFILYIMAGLLFIISLVFKPINVKALIFNILGLLLLCSFIYLLPYIF